MGCRLAYLAVIGPIFFCSLASAQSEADQPEAPLPLTCPAGTPIGPVNLQVKSPANADPLPFSTINHLSEKDTVLYTPIIKGKAKREGEVSLVLVPAKRDPEHPALIVTDPKPASKHQEWTVPQTITVAAFVYGPGGLSKKRVAGFLSQDDQLVTQLADYAEKTSQVEQLLTAISENSSSAGMNAALNGFASQYGLAVQIDKTAPPAIQAQTLFETMNPQLASYNPLASSSGERVGQTASLATAAATLFFGSPIGLAAGGTAMLLDLRYIAFPDTVFRSSFAQTLPQDEGLNLCGQRGALPPHSRAAYIWATRIPNEPTPALTIEDESYIPQRLKTAVPVKTAESEWKYLQRARHWTLRNNNNVATEISVVKLGNQHALEIGLDKVNLALGDYHLAGFWDWSAFEAKGLIHVRPLTDFKSARIDPDSQNALLAHEGKVAITLTGSDFDFANKVELKKTGDEFAVTEPVRFLLPKGEYEGPQDKMDVQIDTTHLDAGRYQLLISQDDGKAHPVDLSILPNAPVLENLPVLLNQGVAEQHFVLKGERLQLLLKLESPQVGFELGETSAGGNERNLILHVKGTPKSGTTWPIAAYLSDRSEPMRFDYGVKITGPLPVIASSRLSLPTGVQVSLLPDEFPAGSTLTALLDVKNIQPQSVLRLGCSEGVGPNPSLNIGQQNATSNLQQLSPDQLFLSYETADLPSGCTLMAQVDNGLDGKSQSVELAHLRRLPQISSFVTAGASSAGGTQNFELRGTDLEMIGELGWTADTGKPVAALPTPIPGQGQGQSMIVTLPEPPAPKTTLFIWLRGDTQTAGRVTTVCLASCLGTAKQVSAQ